MEAGAIGLISLSVLWAVGEELKQGQGHVLIQHPPTENTIVMVIPFKAYIAIT